MSILFPAAFGLPKQGYARLPGGRSNLPPMFCDFVRLFVDDARGQAWDRRKCATVTLVTVRNNQVYGFWSGWVAMSRDQPWVEIAAAVERGKRLFEFIAFPRPGQQADDGVESCVQIFRDADLDYSRRHGIPLGILKSYLDVILVTF
jgi:hypothetical protein